MENPRRRRRGVGGALTLFGELGADTVVRYDDETLRETVGDSFDGGADVILDCRVHEYLPFDVDVSAFGGRVVVYGGSEGPTPTASRRSDP